MNNGYTSFKKKILKNHFIRFLIISFSLFLFVFGILLILTKTKVSSLSIIVDFLIAFACFLLVGLLGFLLKPNNKKIAKKLDKDFDLKNRVQTMIEMENKDGIIVELQKEDTEEKLKNIPLKNLKFKAPFLFVFIFLVGFSATISGAVIKVKEPEVEPEKEYTLTELQIIKLEELKKQIENSKIDNNLIVQYNAQIDSLITTLKGGIKESLLESKVKETIDNINLINEAYANNKTIGGSLNKIENKYYSKETLSSLEIQTNKFVGYWKTKTETNNKFVITSTLVKIGDNSFAIDKDKSVDNTIVANLVGNTEEKVTLSYNSETKSINYNNEEYFLYEPFTYYRAIGRNLYNYEDNLSNLISFIAQDYTETRTNDGVVYLTERLNLEETVLKDAINSSGLPQDNAYVVAFTDFIDELSRIQNEGTASIISSLESALNELENKIKQEFNKEKEVKTETDYITKTIKEIFSIENYDNPSDKLVDEDDSTINNSSTTDNKNNKDPEQLEDGGVGKGDKNYASFDKFFDMDSDGNPILDDDNNLYAYGNFYAEYKTLYENLLIEGYLSEEIEAYLEVYFNSLIHGTK